MVIFALITGCATTITTMDGRTLALNSTDFREYVERVFREQNQAATALAFAQDESSGARYETLLELEDALLEACADLNEVAAARRDDRALGLRRQARMAATAPGCESTTRQTQEALDALAQGAYARIVLASVVGEERARDFRRHELSCPPPERLPFV